jgi:hypothetical protein
LHLLILYEYQQFFQHRICFSIQPQLQLVNLHRNRRYFVIKLHTSDFYVHLRVEVGKFYVRFLKIFYSETTGKFTLAMYFYLGQFFQHRICFSIQPQLQLVNLHRNGRYFVIKLHTWFCLSYFLKTNIKFYSIYQYKKVLRSANLVHGSL